MPSVPFAAAASPGLSPGVDEVDVLVGAGLDGVEPSAPCAAAASPELSPVVEPVVDAFDGLVGAGVDAVLPLVPFAAAASPELSPVVEPVVDAFDVFVAGLDGVVVDESLLPQASAALAPIMESADRRENFMKPPSRHPRTRLHVGQPSIAG